MRKTYADSNFNPQLLTISQTEDIVYLTEVKDRSKIQDPDVVAKKNRGIQYCKTVSEWAKANGVKEWRYLFIPHDKILPNSSFKNLTDQFTADEIKVVEKR